MRIEELRDVHDAIAIGQRRDTIDLLIDDQIGFDVAGGKNRGARAA